MSLALSKVKLSQSDLRKKNGASKEIQIRLCLSNHPFRFASFQECGYYLMWQQHVLYHLFWASTPAMGVIPVLRTSSMENENVIKLVPWNDSCGLGDICKFKTEVFDLRGGLMER